MESSEDDAGNATSASCRASAREKEIGQAEEVGPTRDTQHEPPEASASGTPAMSEDNSDGDSAPSPSQDVNTSTEAILDMIDEFVDGPGAPKRLPLSMNTDKCFDLDETLESLTETVTKQTNDTVEQPRTPSPATIDKSEILNESTPNKSEVCTPLDEDCANTRNITPQVLVSVDKTETFSNQQQTENNSAVLSVEAEALALQSVSDSPSSSVQMVPNISNISVCEHLERTIKCATSSDNVTVERAESTSSECSVSESKSFPVEPLSRSPLKRRLVRPAPSDRRPDSTVSSTVDSQTVNIHTTQPTSCDVIVKDVSSSSDTVPLQHGNMKPEEISKVSEISICKAETSTSPKRIRLIRPKVTPVLSNSVKTPEALTPEKECQSTSSEKQSSDSQASPIFPVVPTTSRVGTPESEDHDRPAATLNSVTENVTLQAFETVPYAKISEKAKGNFSSIDGVENATLLNSTNSPSYLSTIKSEELKSCAVQEAPSEIQSELKSPGDQSKLVKHAKLELAGKQSILFEPAISEESKPESAGIQSNLLEPAKSEKSELIRARNQSKLLESEELEPSNIHSELKPTEVLLVSKPDKILSNKSESIDVKPTQELESSKSVGKISLELTEVQSKVSESSNVYTKKSDDDLTKELKATHDHSQESEPNETQYKELTLTQSKSEELKSPQLETKELEITESVPHMWNLAEIPLKKLTPTESLSRQPKGQSAVIKPPGVQSKSRTPTVCLSQDLEPTKILTQVQITQAPTESELKKIEPTQDQSREKPTENQLELLESTQPQSRKEQTEILPKAKEEPTKSQTKVSEPIQVQSIEKPTMSLTKVLEGIQVQSIEEPTVSAPKVLESKESQLKGWELSQVQSKELIPAESQSNESKQSQVHVQSEELKPRQTQSKVLKPEEIQLNEPKATESQPKLLEPARCQSKDLELELTQLIPPQIKLNQLNPTNVDSRKNEHMKVDSESKESELIKLKESEHMLAESETLKDQTLESLDGVKRRPPIKLTLMKVLKSDKKTNDLGTQSISKIESVMDISHQSKLNPASNTSTIPNCDSSTKVDPSDEVPVDQKKVPPIKLNLASDHNSSSQNSPLEENPDSTKQVPKLTIKLGNKQPEEMKSPIPKLTIKSIRPPTDQNIEDSFENNQQIPSVTKLNIKPIVKPQGKIVSPADIDIHNQVRRKEQIPSITKLNIKPIPKPAEKINDMHRKSSSSEISESEYSENDETSTSDQASASDQGPPDTIPKVTIKLGKPGTECEGKFYTEKNIPKLTIKGLHQNENDEMDAKHKLVISQSEDTTLEKIPKLTIKTVPRSESQPLSPKLTIKPIKQPENENEILKLKITTDAFGSSSEIKDNMHVPKITIKAITKTDPDAILKTPKKSTLMCDSSDHIPIVTKLNIKPILKPTESGESSEDLVDKVPVVSKLNIKPIVKPKDSEIDSSVEDVPKIIKLNIKPLKNPDENSSEEKDCDENIVDMVDKSIPVVTKLNIKPIIKPEEDERLKDSENQSSETGTSSDDNSDHIPVVTKLNIKPIVKPSEVEEVTKPTSNEQSIPVVTKLNIKPLVKPEDNPLPSSPKKESLKSPGSSSIPIVTKLNIKPIIKPEEINENKTYDENMDKSTKNPPLLMKINMKNVCDNITDQKYNNYVDGTKSPRSPRQPMSPKIKKPSLTPDTDQSKSIIVVNVESRKNNESSPDSSSLASTVAHRPIATQRYCLPEKNYTSCSKENKSLSIETEQVTDKMSTNKNEIQINEVHERNADLAKTLPISPGIAKQKKSLQNCTLLKQLLSNTKDDLEKSREMSISNCLSQSEKPETLLTNVKILVDGIRKHNSDLSTELGRKSPISEIANDLSHSSKSFKARSIQDLRKEVNESVTKPLEIVTDKPSNQSSGQDSPRIILKINKTDHGPSAKIITEESHKPKDSPPQNHAEHISESIQEKESPKKHYINSRKKLTADETISLTIGKRLRSSRVMETPEKPPVIIRRNPVKRSSVSETSPTSNTEIELSVLDSKRLKLEQLLSANKGLTITPVASNFTQTSPSKPHSETKQGERKNCSLLNSDNSKNGNSKLHNILSNLQAKQMKSLQLSEAKILNKDPIIIPDAESNTSTGSSDVVVDISRLENCYPDVQEMIINENSEFRDLSTPDEISQDPLEVEALKTVEEAIEPASIKIVEVTPTPRKRGRPRKIPLSEDSKPTKTPKPSSPPVLPVSALEERPQRSLRLMRERPVIAAKPRGGRGRGRGGRRAASPIAAPSPASDDESSETLIVIETLDDDEPQRPVTPLRPVTPEDPTSSRIKLPRMTEALDKSSACITPLSSRRRSSTDMKLFGEPSVVIESVNPVKIEEYMKSPNAKGIRGRGSRGGRGTPRGRTPRGRGRGRGGGKGATYMKETMGIYGRVCGPATTTVELFEEETCMMDDNATPKPTHLLDEDSQSSVKSSTNEGSNKMKKSKFADLFDSNKVWAASDVKEYTWPPRDVPNVDHQVMMIQEQVAMFLGVKSFKRRYAELKRRAVVGEEKDYCLGRGIVTEALCDLGITAVDASDVLDIMLSDYPHKYEEYRSYQRLKQRTESLEEADLKLEEKASKIEIKSEKTSDKPEPPKVDPEKTRQDMAAAAIASAAEWNAMANAWRRPACVDLQSNTIHRRRAPPLHAPSHCRPPHGFYPHAILPGQFQHSYRAYTPEQLRYFPLNTVIAAPPAPPSPVESSSESEGTWADSSSASEDSHEPHHSAKRKKLTKVKRSSQQDKDKDDSRGPPAPEEVVDLCRVCKLRLEANRKYTHERFLVCAHCNAKLHPSCVELNADTIRKCREYPWQCADCKTCYTCRQPGQDDKMLFCDLCDRGFHIQCVGLSQVPSGRWHCVECAVCKSCGARDAGGLPGAAGAAGAGASAAAEWHHQTRRGPGGHKVYSHSLCTPCARAYRIGRYCPLCERSFIGPKGTMQLVICKLCDRQLHQECVRATVSALKVLDYTCAECRRGGITSRAGAVRAAPRTIATLFMAKRRFNKYAHKQYMQSRRQEKQDAPDAPDAPDASDPETCLEASDPLDAADSRTEFGD